MNLVLVPLLQLQIGADLVVQARGVVLSGSKLRRTKLAPNRVALGSGEEELRRAKSGSRGPWGVLICKGHHSSLKRAFLRYVEG